MGYLRLLQLRRGCFYSADTGGMGGVPGDTGADTETGNQEDGKGEEKGPNFDEVLKDKTFQSEFDRRVSKAIDTAKTKWEQETKSKIDAAKTEAEKLAKMNAEQRADHEREQLETGVTCITGTQTTPAKVVFIATYLLGK